MPLLLRRATKVYEISGLETAGWVSGTREVVEADLDGAGSVVDPDGEVLDGDLESHGSLGEPGESLGLGRGNGDDGDVSEAREPRLEFLPPEGDAGSVGDHGQAVDAGRDAEEASFVGQTDFDPMEDVPGGIFLPEAGFVRIPEVLGELEGWVGVRGGCVEGEGEQADEHALVGFGRVPCERDRVFGVDLAVEVGEMDLGLVNDCFEGHGRRARE